MLELREEEEDYLDLVIILSLLIVNYLILAGYNPLVCPLLCDRQEYRGGEVAEKQPTDIFIILWVREIY